MRPGRTQQLFNLHISLAGKLSSSVASSLWVIRVCPEGCQVVEGY
jgi:hypothetical protein